MDTKIMEGLMELTKDLKEALTGKVIKSVPVRKDWRKPLADLVKARDEAKRALEIAESKKRLFWAIVENDLGVYDPMRYNDETDEIEILDK